MKIFQSLLVAPAALGLLTPVAANANEVNLNDISNYSDVGSIDFANSFNNDLKENALLAGGEGLVEDSSLDGSFSETTTASFSADMYIGVLDDQDVGGSVYDDNVMTGYSFQIDLNTSFTGEDSLDISLDAGNAGSEGIAEFDGNGGGDALSVDGVAYTFPVLGATAFVGDNSDASSLFTTACAYGGPSNTLDDCGAPNAGPTGGGVAAGVSYDFGSGFVFATGIQTSETDVLNNESLDAYAFNGSYTADNYGLSITYGVVESSVEEDNTFTALNGYYTFDDPLIPSISVGLETGDIGGATSGADEQESFFVGLTWDEVGPGSAGFAAGHANTVEGSDEAYMYEVYYDYPVNDGMTITPLVFAKDVDGADDTTGVMVKTSFSF